MSFTVRLLPLIALLLLGSLASFPLHANSTCTAIPGSEPLEKARIVIFGEYHGTNEIPKLIGDLTCSLLHDGDPVLVAMELDRSLDPFFQRIFTDGEDAARVLTEIRALAFWNTLRDGRHGQANLDLIHRFAELRQQFPELRLVALHRDGKFSERAAHRIKSLAEQLPDYRILVLTGNAHASRQGFRGYPGEPFAARLATMEPSLLGLTVRTGGGSFIGCLPEGCQVLEAREFNTGNPDQRQIHLFSEPGQWDGYFYLPELTVTEPVR